MQLIAIQNPQSDFEHRLVDEMHRLRARVFQDRLAWDVHSVCGREFDQFDRLSPTYILALGEQGAVVGCARLLPATGVTMLQSVFPQLLREGILPRAAAMIESSRFCVDTGYGEGRGEGAIHGATLAMFAGIVEWSMVNGYSEIVTATDVRLERILRRTGWALQRLGEPVMINETRSIAGILPADAKSFQRLRPAGYSSSFSVLHRRAA